ncbi:MAG TPA: YbaK/EbsC family protein [Kribbella sp.]|nr:YbaK/EbsC family protein [Kribbella sp.]
MTAPTMGKLDWQPAADHPDLLAEPVRAVLGDLAVYAAAIDPGLADTAAFCAEYDVQPAASANCVIVHGKRAGESTYAAVMVLATHRADVNGVIRKHLGVRKISFAAQDDAVGSTGMEYGGITPIGLPSDWPVLVDAAVAQAGPVVIGSGIRGSKLLLAGADLAGLPTATVLELATPA